MKVKYNRVSSVQQNSQRQEQNKTSFSAVYLDRCSGAIKLSERKEGRRLIKDIEAGKVTEVHVSAIDRLGRNIIDVLTTIELFNKHGVNLFVEAIGMYSLINSKPNSSFAMIVSVLANVASMEREFLLERQRQGIEVAKAKGVYKGRLYGSKMKDSHLLEKYKKVVKELKAGQSLRRAAAIGECSLGTAQRVQAILAKAA
ncbi:MAG: recombinase family protein [Ferruginibacter sp.]